MPTTAMKAIPTMRMGSPMGVKAKNPKGSRPMLSRWALTTRFGGVPMRVSIPPRSDATDRGIRSLDGDMSRAQASPTTTGSMTATVPVELMNPERSATRSMITTRSRTSLSPASFWGQRPMAWATPVWKSPSPTTKSAAIMRTTGSENPASASGGVRIPVRRRARRARSATTSSRSLSVTKRTTVTMMIP